MPAGIFVIRCHSLTKRSPAHARTEIPARPQLLRDPSAWPRVPTDPTCCPPELKPCPLRSRCSHLSTWPPFQARCRRAIRIRSDSFFGRPAMVAGSTALISMHEPTICTCEQATRATCMRLCVRGRSAKHRLQSASQPERKLQHMHMRGTVPCSTCTNYAGTITAGVSAGKRWPRADGQKSPWHPLLFLHCELSRGREAGISVFSAKKRLCRLNRSTGPGAIASGHPGLAATASRRARKIGLKKV